LSAGAIIAIRPALGSAPGATHAIVPALPGVSEARLAAAFADCARTVQARARNFFYGLRLTPEPRRGAIYSIYAWMRAADDLADAQAPINTRRLALAEFRERTRRALDGLPAPEGHPEPAWWPAFAATATSYPIDPSIFTDMLDGLEQDLGCPGYDDDAALHEYCYRVAGTAGLACLWIWGLRDGADPAEARELALRRGQAFQRTNILRDFAQDFDETPSRVYIPRDAFARHGLTPEDLRRWEDWRRCAALVAEQAALAREHYDASARLETLIDPACAPTLWAMTRIYAGLLEVIEQDPARVVGGRRIRLASHRKASIALTAAIRARMNRW
jgi:phytoene synthase